MKSAPSTLIQLCGLSRNTSSATSRYISKNRSFSSPYASSILQLTNGLSEPRARFTSCSTRRFSWMTSIGDA